MSESEPMILTRTPSKDRSEIQTGVHVAYRGKCGTVVAMPHPSDANRMLSVLFDDEGNPREVRLADVCAVVGTVQVRPAGGVLVIYYDTGVSTNGTPGRLGVFLNDSGDVSLVCDGWPIGGAHNILPAYLRRFGRQGEMAEAAALWALGRLCVTSSTIFADHAMSVSTLRQFVKTRAEELNVVTP